MDEEITLHPGQQEAWSADSRFVAMIAGTGGGKTFFGPIWLYNEISLHPGERWIVVSPTDKIMRRTTRPEFVRALQGTDAQGKMKERAGEYILPDGGIIYFCSADRPDYLEGGQFKGAWLDEAGQMKRWVWVVIQARLGLKQGRALITTTPYGKNWLYYDFVRKAEEGDPDYFVTKFPSVENPYYPLAEFNRMKGVLSPEEFRMRYEANFEILGGLLFPNFDRAIVNRVRLPQPAEISEDYRVGGIDFGWTAPTAILTGFMRDEHLYIYREFYETQQTTADMANYLDRSTVYFADPAAAREIEELCQLGFDVRPSINDFRPGIVKVNEFVNAGLIHVPEGVCPYLISEAANYVAKEGEEKPAKGSLDHACDALRYMIMGIDVSSPLQIYFI